MRIVRLASIVAFSLLVVLLLAATAVNIPAQTRTQSSQSSELSDADLQKIESDCSSGRSTFTRQQCAFFVQTNEAMRRVNPSSPVVSTASCRQARSRRWWH